jgi:hypothetical protein
MGDEPRYDRNSLETALKLASRLQQEHETTLSVSQIEAIGSEVGLDPVFVRRALDALETSPTSPSRISAHRTDGLATVAPATVVFTVELVLVACLNAIYSGHASLPTILAFGLTLAATPIVGVRQSWMARHKRWGALVGALGAETLLLSVMIVASRGDDALVPLSLLALLGGAGAGALVTRIRDRWDRRPTALNATRRVVKGR